MGDVSPDKDPGSSLLESITGSAQGGGTQSGVQLVWWRDWEGFMEEVGLELEGFP